MLGCLTSNDAPEYITKLDKDLIFSGEYVQRFEYWWRQRRGRWSSLRWGQSSLRGRWQPLSIQVNLCQKLLFLQNMGRTCCVHKLFWMSKSISVHNMYSPCSELGISRIELVNSMNNTSSYCGLVDAKIRASDKDLPLQCRVKLVQFRSIGIILTTESFADGSSEVGRA